MAAFMFGIAGLLFSIPSMVGVNDRSGDWIVDLTGVIVAGFGVFVTFGLIAIVRTRISLSPTTLDATVPGHHSRLLVPSFRAIRVALPAIRSVERRHEIVRSFGLNTLRESLSVVTAAGERIGLFSNTMGPASTLPLDAIAAAIASAAGIAVTDGGTVISKAQGLYGEASSSWTEQPLDQTSAAKARLIAVRTAQICVGLLLFTLVLRACL